MAFSSSARNLSLCGTITYLTGQSVSFSGQDALDFSRMEGVSDGFLLGCALSSSFTLSLYDGDGRFTLSHAPYGASLMVYLKEGDLQFSLGRFIVSYANRSELTGVLTLSGGDAMATAFDGLWEDDLSYPLSLGALAGALAARVGFHAAPSFPGSQLILTEKPNWGEITIRRALSFLCEAAGCFASIDAFGQLCLKSANPTASPFVISADVTLSRMVGDQRFGRLQGIQVSLAGASRDDPPLILQENGAVLGQDNCLYLSGNPLFAKSAAHTASLAQHLFSHMQGFSLRQLSVAWSGDPALSLGQPIVSSYADGDALSTLVTRQTLRFSDGFSMESACTLNRRGSAVGRLFTASGALNAAMLQGEADGVIIRGNSLAASSIVSGSITAQQLAADAITAEKIGAAAVTAEKLAANAITADKIAAGAITADKLTANAVKARHLSADALEAVDAEIEGANIGYAQIKDANVQNLITKDAIADRYYIQKLFVENLQVLQQTVANLVIKASNGNYYRLDMNGNGGVTAQQVTVTSGEAQAGVTSAGKSIIETSILASDLSAQNIKGANALIDKITASRLDVGTLFARQATINALNTIDISSNTSLRLQAQDQIDLAVRNIQIGGVNLLTGTKDFSGGTNVWGSYRNRWQNDGVYKGLTAVKQTGAWFELYTSYTVDVRVGEVYTFSAYAKRSAGGIVQYLLNRSTARTNKPDAVNVTSQMPEANVWYRISDTFTITAAGRLCIGMYNAGGGEGGSEWVSLCGWQLERGSKATDWSLSPEDIDRGRNLLPGTQDFSGDWENAGVWSNDTGYEGFTVKTKAGTWNRLCTPPVNVLAGETYTASAYIKRNAYASMRFYTNQGTATSNSNDVSVFDQMPDPNIWYRVSRTFTVTASGVLRMTFQNGTQQSGGTPQMWICGWKLEKGASASQWTPAENELKNSSISITEGGISIETSGRLRITGETEGAISLPNGAVGAQTGTFDNLSVGAQQIGSSAFLMPIPVKFTQGQTSAPSGHGFLWINASGSNYTTASAQGATTVGYLPRSFTLGAPGNTLPSGTFSYTITCGITNRQGNNADTISGVLKIKITNGSNTLTFTFASVTLRKWQSQVVTATASSSSVNLFATNSSMTAECTWTPSVSGQAWLDMDGVTPITLTAQKSGTSGTQTTAVLWVP